MVKYEQVQAFLMEPADLTDQSVLSYLSVSPIKCVPSCADRDKHYSRKGDGW